MAKARRTNVSARMAAQSAKFVMSAKKKKVKLKYGHRAKSKNSDASQKSAIAALLPTVEALREPKGAVRFLEGVRQSFRMLKGQYREHLKQEIVRIYATALVLAEDQDAWSDFCRAPDWEQQKKRPAASHQSDALRYALRFAVGFTKGGAKRANLFLRATKTMFDERMPPDKVLAKLAKSSIARLARKGRPRESGDEIPVESVHAASIDADVSRSPQLDGLGNTSKRTPAVATEEDGWITLKLRHPKLTEKLLSFGQKDKVRVVFIVEANDNVEMRGKLTSVKLIKDKDPG